MNGAKNAMVSYVLTYSVVYLAQYKKLLAVRLEEPLLMLAKENNPNYLYFIRKAL